MAASSGVATSVQSSPGPHAADGSNVYRSPSSSSSLSDNLTSTDYYDYINIYYKQGDSVISSTNYSDDVILGQTGNGLMDVPPSPADAPLLKQSPPAVALFTVAYGVVLILAVVNNVLVVTAIQRNQQLRTVTNMFVANLAVADITVSLLVLPITLLTNLFTEWQFGAFLCRAIPYLQAVAVGASSNTLVAVAVERYLAIFYAGTVTISPNHVVIIITVIWMVPACVQIPWAVYSKQQDFLADPATGTMWTYCYQDWASKEFEKGFFLGVVFLTCYFIPLLFLAVFYSMIGVKVWKRSVAGIQGSRAEKNINRSKIRIVRMLVVVTTTFALSWLPLYTIRLCSLFGPEIPMEHKLLLRDTIIPLAQWLGSANSCVNPFVYCYFSEHFRKAIAGTLSSSCKCCRSCVCCQRLLLNKHDNQQSSPRTQTTKVIVQTTPEKDNTPPPDGKTAATQTKDSMAVMPNANGSHV